MEARELLKKIGVTNEIQEIKEFESHDLYGTGIEITHKIVTELGEIDFRIVRLNNGTYSKLDYFSTAYTFSRNVNTLAEFK